MPRLLEEIYRLQRELTDLDPYDRMILKMTANLLESHHQVTPRNEFTVKEFHNVPGRWELLDGMLADY
jgi:hypothetical protein